MNSQISCTIVICAVVSMKVFLSLVFKIKTFLSPKLDNEGKLRESKEFCDYFYNLKMEYLGNRKTIWQKIQKKLIKLINTSQHVSSFASNSILDFLIYTNRFIEIGEDFSLFSSKE